MNKNVIYITAYVGLMCNLR